LLGVAVVSALRGFSPFLSHSLPEFFGPSPGSSRCACSLFELNKIYAALLRGLSLLLLAPPSRSSFSLLLSLCSFRLACILCLHQSPLTRANKKEKKQRRHGRAPYKIHPHKYTTQPRLGSVANWRYCVSYTRHPTTGLRVRRPGGGGGSASLQKPAPHKPKSVRRPFKGVGRRVYRQGSVLATGRTCR